MEPFFWHQTPACQAPLIALSGSRKIYERKLGKQVDEIQLGRWDDQSRLSVVGFSCLMVNCSALAHQGH